MKMKASEVIKALQELMAEYGDLEVMSEGCEVNPHYEPNYWEHPIIEL